MTTNTEAVIKNIKEIQEMINYHYPDQVNELDYVKLHIQDLARKLNEKEKRVLELEEELFTKSK